MAAPAPMRSTPSPKPAVNLGQGMFAPPSGGQYLGTNPLSILYPSLATQLLGKKGSTAPPGIPAAAQQFAGLPTIPNSGNPTQGGGNPLAGTNPSGPAPPSLSPSQIAAIWGNMQSNVPNPGGFYGASPPPVGGSSPISPLPPLPPAGSAGGGVPLWWQKLNSLPPFNGSRGPGTNINPPGNIPPIAGPPTMSPRLGNQPFPPGKLPPAGANPLPHGMFQKPVGGPITMNPISGPSGTPGFAPPQQIAGWANPHAGPPSSLPPNGNLQQAMKPRYIQPGSPNSPPFQINFPPNPVNPQGVVRPYPPPPPAANIGYPPASTVPIGQYPPPSVPPGLIQMPNTGGPVLPTQGPTNGIGGPPTGGGLGGGQTMGPSGQPTGGPRPPVPPGGGPRPPVRLPPGGGGVLGNLAKWIGPIGTAIGAGTGAAAGLQNSNPGFWNGVGGSLVGGALGAAGTLFPPIHPNFPNSPQMPPGGFGLGGNSGWNPAGPGNQPPLNQSGIRPLIPPGGLQGQGRPSGPTPILTPGGQIGGWVPSGQQPLPPLPTFPPGYYGG